MDMKKLLIPLIVVFLIVSALTPAAFAGKAEYVKSGHISATLPRLMGGKEITVSVDYTISLDTEGWNTAWPMTVSYKATLKAGDWSQTVEDEVELNGFGAALTLWSSFPDDVFLYHEEKELPKGSDSEEYNERLDRVYLVIEPPPFWGGSDVGFKLWAKSQFSKTKVYLMEELSLWHEINVWNHSKVLEVSGVNMPTGDKFTAYQAKTTAYILSDSKNLYGSLNETSFNYYEFGNTWRDVAWDVSEMLADQNNIYMIILPYRNLRQSDNPAGYVFKTPYSGGLLKVRTTALSQNYYYIPYDDFKPFALGVLDGKLGKNAEPIEIVKTGQWLENRYGSYTRLFIAKIPPIPMGSEIADRAYQYYYNWEAYTPDAFPVWIVGTQEKSKDGKYISDYFYHGYGCSGVYSEILEQGLKRYNLANLPAVDRALIEIFPNFLGPCYASYTFRYQWLADWLFDAVYKNQQWEYIPGNAYMEVPLGQKHIKAYRNGKDVSRDIDVPAQVVNGRMLVPVRHISEPLGAKVGWDGKERKVTISLNGHTVEMWIDNPVGRIDGREYKMPSGVPPMIINNRTMVPLRFVAEALGAEVQWDFYNKTAIIRYLPDQYPTE